MCIDDRVDIRSFVLRTILTISGNFRPPAKSPSNVTLRRTAARYGHSIAAAGHNARPSCRAEYSANGVRAGWRDL